MLDPVAVVGRISAVPTILRMITETTGLRLSLVAHVTESTWTCCAVNDELQFGLERGGQLDVATTLCAEVRQSATPILISHASQDATYGAHRTPKLYAFESYIAVPIFLPNGTYFGNVCALDSKPIALGDRQLQMFQLFADLVGRQLDIETSHAATVQALESEKETGVLREQFIAVLGHDVRAPLNSISLAAQALELEAPSAKARALLLRLRRSATRIQHLVDDVLDFAHGRLGTGVPLRTARVEHVDELFLEVADELRVAHVERELVVDVARVAPIVADATRLGQLLQNLLANALVHSPPDARVVVHVSDDGPDLVLRVANDGPRLSDELRRRMFHPFERGERSTRGGLGLGLYIASEIVRSHRGTIAVHSDDQTTTITCRIPRTTA